MPVREVSAREMLGGKSLVVSGVLYRGREKFLAKAAKEKAAKKPSKKSET